MNDTTHRCPSPGCMVRVPRSKFACVEHWRSLPKPMQTAITSEYRNRRVDGGRAHMLAMLDAMNWMKAQIMKKHGITQQDIHETRPPKLTEH